MSRISALDPAAAQGKAKHLLDAVRKSLGITPNMFRVLHCPNRAHTIVWLAPSFVHSLVRSNMDVQ